MRRALIVLASLLVSARVAHALEHNMRINEVLLSNNGSTTSQYVELHDAVTEPFPNQPYTLQFFDANANSIGSVTLSLTANSTDWFVSTAQADTDFGTTGNDTLSVALPTDGQVCFVDSGGFKIHCLAWGCVNTLAGTLSNTSKSASPPDSMSSQRNNAVPNHYHISAPSPQAANTDAAETLPFCATAPDAGVGTPDAAPGSPDAMSASPDANGNPDNGNSSGCCEVGTRGGGAGAGLLALATLLLVRRKR